MSQLLTAAVHDCPLQEVPLHNWLKASAGASFSKLFLIFLKETLFFITTNLMFGAGNGVPSAARFCLCCHLFFEVDSPQYRSLISWSLMVLKLLTLMLCFIGLVQTASQKSDF